MQRERGITLACATATLLIALAYAVLGKFGQWPDHIDNWNLWELSLGLTQDFYHVWNLRFFATEAGSSISYPPLYPALIAVTDAVTGLGPASGTLVNYACVAAFAGVNMAIGWHIAGSRAAGLLIAAAMLCFLPFGTEIVGARSHPVALLILALIGLVVIRSPITVATASLVGFLAGLGMMARFDFLLPSLILGGLILLWSRRVAPPLAYGLGALIGASPWIIHSWSAYHTPYASDSRWSAMAKQPGLWPNDWVAPPGPEPMASVGDVVHKLVLTADVPVELASDYVRHILPVVAALVVAWAGAALLGRLRAAPAADPRRALYGSRDLSRLAMLLLIWPPLIFSAWLAGYPSVRYLSGLHWNLLALGILAATLHYQRSDPILLRRATVIAAAGLVVAGTGLAWRNSVRQRFNQPALVLARVAQVQRCLLAVGAQPGDRVMFALNEGHGAQFGPLARWASASPPHNAAALTTADWAAYLKFGGIRYIVGGDSVGRALAILQDPNPLPGCPIPIHPVASP